MSKPKSKAKGPGNSGQITWKNERRKLGELVPWEHNPRFISPEAGARLTASLDEFGQIQTIAIEPDNTIIDGHQRDVVWKASEKFGPDYEVDVRVSNRKLTNKERGRLIALLHQGTTGQWDWDLLANLPDIDIDDLVKAGFDEKVLLDEAFGTEAGTADAEPQMDKAAELNKKWKCATGQLWAIGSHRLLVGDSTMREDVDRVMGREKATLVFTDPPYGVSIGKKNVMLNTFQKAGRCLADIEADDMKPEQLGKMLLKAFTLCREVVMAEDCSVFVCSPQGGGLGMMMMMMMKDAGLEVRHVLNWVKNCATFSMGRLDYDYQHEPILFTWGKTHKRIMAGPFKTSVWSVDKPCSSGLHATTKPTELPSCAILNHTEEGDVVFDGFCGSGTTLIAAENHKRRGRGIELKPDYCAVILQRMKDAFPGIAIERLP
jgi:DNA modification methylase